VTARGGAARDPRSLSNAELEAGLHDLQQRAFAIYERAALAAEDDPGGRDAAAYAQAETDAAPLIAQARALNDERVRRLRARARWWHIAALAVGVLGSIAIAWRLMRS